MMRSSCLLLVIFGIFVWLAECQIEFDIYKADPPAHYLRSKRHIFDSLAKPKPTPNPWTNDSIVLYKFLNGEYYGEIGVGSPAKTFKVIFATTWADTYLPSSHCPWTEIVCKLHTQYDSSKSSSYIPNGRLINLTNSELSLVGLLSTDTFYLPHVQVSNQTFLEATHISLDPFLQYRADGIVGLAFREQSGWDNVTPFFYNMMYQNVIKEHVFTFYMNRDETTGKAGKVILGGRQRTHVLENTTTTINTIGKKFWQIEMDSVYAMKNKTMYPICEKCIAIFDSSSNTITGPPNDIIKLNYMLNAVYLTGLNRYTVNCREYAKLPQVHFVLNGNEYVIQSKYYVQRLTLGNIEACLSPFVANSNASATYWELGGAFMMEFYTEFDMDNRNIYIGQTKF